MTSRLYAGAIFSPDNQHSGLLFVEEYRAMTLWKTRVISTESQPKEIVVVVVVVIGVVVVMVHVVVVVIPVVDPRNIPLKFG